MDDFLDLLNRSLDRSKKKNLQITPDMDIIHDLGMTSLDMMILLFEIEHTYHVSLQTDKLKGIRTVSDLYNLILMDS